MLGGQLLATEGLPDRQSPVQGSSAYSHIVDTSVARCFLVPSGVRMKRKRLWQSTVGHMRFPGPLFIAMLVTGIRVYFCQRQHGQTPPRVEIVSTRLFFSKARRDIVVDPRLDDQRAP